MDNEQIHEIIRQLLKELPPASVSSEDIKLLTLAQGVVPAALLEATSDLLCKHGIIVDRLGDSPIVANRKQLRFVLAQFAAVEMFEGNIKASRDWMRRPAAGLANNRPIDLLQTMEGYKSVLDLIKIRARHFPVKNSLTSAISNSF